MGVGGQRHAPTALPRERPGTHCVGGSVVPRAGVDRCGKFLPTGIRSPDRQARSETLYRQSYPGPRRNIRRNIKYVMLINSCSFRLLHVPFPRTQRGVVTCVAVTRSSDVMTQGLACHTTLE